ncbi:MAG: response regulator [Alphaproteobacteria bacterium]|nr:response regulator [Alphaproteobacteria bacterium]
MSVERYVKLSDLNENCPVGTRNARGNPLPKNSGGNLYDMSIPGRDKGDTRALDDRVRNALNAIEGLSFALMETDLDDQQRECLRQLLEAGSDLRVFLLGEEDFVRGDRWDKAGPPIQTDQPPRPLRILAADDSPTNHLVMEVRLKAAGQSADHVNGGRAALKALSERNYDLLLLDIEMPDLNGLEVAKRVRASKSNNMADNLVIIAVTANSTPTDEALYREVGIDGLISKPVCDKELRETLSALSCKA